MNGFSSHAIVHNCVTVLAVICGNIAVVLFISVPHAHYRQSVTRLVATHACCTILLLFDCKDLLLYRGDSPCPQRQVAGGIQVCHLQFALANQGKDRTCLSEDKRVLQCPCPTLAITRLLYAKELSIIRLTVTPHTIAKRHEACRHTDTLG